MTQTLEQIKREKTWSYITSEAQLIQTCKDLDDYCSIFEAKNRRPKLAWDLETYNPKDLNAKNIRPVKGLDGEYEGRIRLLILGLDPSIEDHQFLIDVKKIGEEVVARHINKFLMKCLLIGQNNIYDLPFIIEFFGIFPPFVRDLLLMSLLFYAGDKLVVKGYKIDDRHHTLADHYENFLDPGWFKSRTGMYFEEYKDYKKRNQGARWGNEILDRDQMEYSADEGSLVHPTYIAMLAKLEEFMKRQNKPGMLNTFLMECDALLEFAVMSLVGVPYDIQYAQDVSDVYLKTKLEEAENALMVYPEFWEEVKNETTLVPLMDGSKIKIQSRKISVPYCKFINIGGKNTAQGDGQLTRALKRAGLPLPNSQQGTFVQLLYDVDKAKDLTDKQKDILANVLKWVRAKGSLLDRYGSEAMAEHLAEDGRFYPSWFQIGADTQRTSCKNPALQTIPGGSKDNLFEDDEKVGEKIRRGIATVPGRSVIVGDWSNQEVRLAYQVSQDPYLKLVFLQNRDQHSEFAKEVFQLDYYPTKTKGGEMRQAGKTGFLQFQYLGGWRATKEAIYMDTKCKVLLTDDEAKNLNKKLKLRYEGMTDLAEECRAEVLKAVEHVQTLREFENRKDIFIGFTRLKYVMDDGTKKEYTRLRRFNLLKEHEQIIKRTKNKEEINSWKLKSKKDILFLLDYYDKDKKAALTTTKFGNLIRKGNFRFVDTLHRNYKKYDRKTKRWDTWNNEFNRRISDIVREYFNFLMQPEGATMLKISMIKIGRAFRERGWHPKKDCAIIAECHDSIIVECRDELAEEAREIMKYWMEKVAGWVIKGIPTPVSIKIGPNWGDAE